MTLGSGILWSTILLILAVTIYQLTVRKRWRTVGKAFGVLLLVGAFIGAAAWGWHAYGSRPQVVTELSGIRLGMTPVEVKLLKGAPSSESEITEEERSPKSREGEEEPDVQEEQKGPKFRLGWSFNEGSSLFVIFYGDTPESLEVSIVCEGAGYSKLLGFGRYDSEEEIVEKLGPPSSESIASDALKKVISYKPWKVAYEITKGSVDTVCITQSGGMRYKYEYGEAEP